MRLSHTLAILLALCMLTACQDEPSQSEPASQTESAAPGAPQPAEPAPPDPPTPPITENFQGEPKLSLFPRVGDYRPENDSERLAFWKTFIDHLVKITGVAESPEDDNRAWSFRSINTIDSVGYFSPVAVEPNTTYRVQFTLKAELPEGASAGVGVIEFDEFLWVGEQYTETLFKEHFRGVHEGVRLSGEQDWPEKGFTFTTRPDTRMVHLVLFREGEHDRNSVLFDNLSIEPITN